MGNPKQTLNYCCIKCGNWGSSCSALYGKGQCKDCYDMSGKNNGYSVLILSDKDLIDRTLLEKQIKEFDAT